MTEVCIKTRTGSYCSASPITDCGCSRDPKFSDPFPPLADKLDQATLVTDLQAGLKTAGSRVPIEKYRIIAQIARLVLLEKVLVGECFVITALDCATTEPAGTGLRA